jgi:glycolate oxidase
MDISRLLQELRTFLNQGQVITDRENMSHFCYDATEQRFMPDVVVQPANTEQVSRAMKAAYDLGIPVTPQGGRTGLSGGALPVRGGVLLSLIRMNRIVEVDEKNLQVVVEPGVISFDLQKEVNKYGLFFPPDPSSTVESTIGGNVAENAGYTRAVKYGVTRDYILGLEVVLPDGEIVNVGGRTVKNVVGYDLVALITGSEGTLGVITKVFFKLMPRPRFRDTVIIYFDDIMKAADVVQGIFKSGIVPSAIELMDNLSISAVAEHMTTELDASAAALVLVEVDGNHRDAVRVEAESIRDIAQKTGETTTAWVADEKDAERFWLWRRETLPSLKAMGKDHLEADVVVPRYALPSLIKTIQDLCEGKKVRIANFGHAGDGNLHVTIMYRKRNFEETLEANELLEEIYRQTVAMNGRLTGEHGVGITAMPFMSLQLKPAEIALMKRIKAAFDPKGLLNPGKIFPDE